MLYCRQKKSSTCFLRGGPCGSCNGQAGPGLGLCWSSSLEIGRFTPLDSILYTRALSTSNFSNPAELSSDTMPLALFPFLDSPPGAGGIFSSEIHIFTVPIAVLLVGFGLSMLISALSGAKKVFLSQFETSTSTNVVANEVPLEKAEEDVDSADDQGVETETAPDRLLPMTMLDKSSCVPSRLGASADFDRNAGILVVCGGMTDGDVASVVNIFAAEERKWVEFQSVDEGFGFVYGYMAMLSECIVVFGGIGEDSHARDVLQIYNFDRLSWEPLPLEDSMGQISPSCRYNGSTSVLDDSTMVIFGGRDGSGRCLNDVWMFELVDFTGRWTKLYGARDLSSQTSVDKYVPEPREGHSSVILGNKLFVFGGNNSTGEVINTGGDCVEVFDLETHTWSFVSTIGEAPEILASGGSAHALTGVDKILVISGESNDSCFNGLYVLDVSSLVRGDKEGPPEWYPYSVYWCGDQSMIPEPRLLYAAALDEIEGDIFIFGGQEVSAETEESLQLGVVVLDVASVMELCSPDDNIAASPVDLQDINDQRLKDCSGVDGIIEGEVDVSSSADSDTENDLDNKVNMGTLFSELNTPVIKKLNVSVENESLQDFLKVKEEVDIAFALKYSSGCELAAMRNEDISDVDSETIGELISSVPLPRSRVVT